MAICMRWNRVATAVLLVTWLQPTLAAVPAPDTVPVHERKYAMGTVFDIVVYSGAPRHAAAAINKAFQEIVRLDGVMSNFKSDSDLSRLNRGAHFHTVSVVPDLYAVIADSQRYSRLSAGKFDITVGPLTDLWKRAMRGGSVPTTAQLRTLEPCVGYNKIELIPPRSIELHSSCLRIDLGAIGKGYAVDRAIAVLRAQGIHCALVDAGGSTMYGMGTPPGQPGWPVTLRDPSHQVHARVLLHNTAVSTSEQSAPSLLSGKRAGHIVDPATGLPLNTEYAVSVLARNATAADALSTTLLLVGPQRGRRLLSRGAGTSAIWISPQGQTITAGQRDIQFQTIPSLNAGGSQ